MGASGTGDNSDITSSGYSEAYEEAVRGAKQAVSDAERLARSATKSRHDENIRKQIDRAIKELDKVKTPKEKQDAKDKNHKPTTPLEIQEKRLKDLKKKLK